MKPKKLISTKMRWTAGVLYGLLSLYEMFTVRELFLNAAITSVPIAWLFELLVLVGAGVMAVWLLGGNAALSQGVRRAVIVATTLVVVFELITYSVQVAPISYIIMTVFPSTATTGTSMHELIAMIIRLLLLILSAFFIQSANAQMDLDKAEEDILDAADNLDEAMTDVEKALTDGADPEDVSKAADAVEEAKKEMASALEEMDEAVAESESEKKES